MLHVLYALTAVVSLLPVWHVGCENTQVGNITGVKFLLTVNDTWADPPGCITTVATNFIEPNLPTKRSPNVAVGDCDHGAFQYTIKSPGEDYCKYSLYLTFHSSVIEDASPPTCTISWNGTYLIPKPMPAQGPWNPNQNLLPSCFTMDSREGYHMTYYWFYILEWQFSNDTPGPY